jgi:hypothetical protein
MPGCCVSAAQHLWGLPSREPSQSRGAKGAHPRSQSRTPRTRPCTPGRPLRSCAWPAPWSPPSSSGSGGRSRGRSALRGAACGSMGGTRGAPHRPPRACGWKNAGQTSLMHRDRTHDRIHQDVEANTALKAAAVQRAAHLSFSTAARTTSAPARANQVMTASHIPVLGMFSGARGCTRVDMPQGGSSFSPARKGRLQKTCQQHSRETHNPIGCQTTSAARPGRKVTMQQRLPGSAHRAQAIPGCQGGKGRLAGRVGAAAPAGCPRAGRSPVVVGAADAGASASRWARHPTKPHASWLRQRDCRHEARTVHVHARLCRRPAGPPRRRPCSRCAPPPPVACVQPARARSGHPAGAGQQRSRLRALGQHAARQGKAGKAAAPACSVAATLPDSRERAGLGTQMREETSERVTPP